MAENSGYGVKCLIPPKLSFYSVGTNHLGHFYLNHLLLPKVNQNAGRIVVTASGVHDPESPGGAQGRTATLGNLEGLERDGRRFEMVDGEPYDGDKAYKDSKVKDSRLSVMHLGLLVPSRIISQQCYTLCRSFAMFSSRGNCNVDWQQTIPPRTLWSIVTAQGSLLELGYSETKTRYF
jgi:hypothetical protein